MGRKRIERRISRRRFATGASAALLGTSLHMAHGGRASQVATPVAPVPAAATPIATPGATPLATPVSGPQLQVSPPEVRFDERFDILVFGIEPGQNVTITSTFTPWTATATYTAQAIYGDPSFGYVDPAAMIPVDGTFDVADTMAFIWAAQATGSPYYAFPQEEAETVTITASIGDVDIGSASIERSIAARDEGPRDVDEDGLVGRFFLPAGESTEPARRSSSSAARRAACRPTT